MSDKEREVEELERMVTLMQEQIKKDGQGVTASTVAGTDYICAHSGESGGSGGINLGLVEGGLLESKQENPLLASSLENEQKDEPGG